ncbi:3-oxoacyl-[acyl-carrier-protein] reductase FabG [Striga asiatica]|uniref:3-oxoacyl-[acyl-carrier-protein] reductase FabG n=1 Tax=Striga asiatica TaxID=4170 RepID=A0A5A7PDI8_STRAF|nr:3-oxoacyl-[acyl-carrier-protein] reductase FabG [Striga asiatica]
MATSQTNYTPLRTHKKGICAIVGVGPKLGRSIARKFSKEGHTIAILSRDLLHASSGQLSAYAEELAAEARAPVYAIRIDCSSAKSIHDAFEAVLSLGFVEVLVYNAHDPVLLDSTLSADISFQRFEKTLSVSVSGAFLCAQKVLHLMVLPKMVQKGRGTILFSGCTASVEGIAGFADLCAAKFGMRGLAHSLARDRLSDPGESTRSVRQRTISPPPSTSKQPSAEPPPTPHQQQQADESSSSSCSSVGDNQVRHEGIGPGLMDPDILAQAYWYLHSQEKSIWSYELNLGQGGPEFF